MDAKTLCLGALANGPASGYDIRKLFEEGSYGCLHPISFGSIYPALTALTAEGLVECTAEEQARRPDKKVYRLTAEGLKALTERMMAPLQPDRFRSDTLVVLTLAHLLPSDHVAGLLQAYRATHQMELDMMMQCPPEDLTPGQKFVHDLGFTMYRALIDHIDRHGEALVAALSDAEQTQQPRGDSAATASAAGNAAPSPGASSRLAAK